MDQVIVKGRQEFLGIEIPVVEGGFGEDKRCILARDIAKLHSVEVKRINEVLRNNIDEFESGVDIIDMLEVKRVDVEILYELGFTKEDIRKSNNIYILSESGYMILFSAMRKKNIDVCESIMGGYFNSDYRIKYTRLSKEIAFLDKLEKVLMSFDMSFKTQYAVLNYRLDAYVPSLNVAIEYDENDHKYYIYDEHEGRQKQIENELGCRFIRVSDKYSDEYNIGVVIKELFNIKAA